MLRSGSASSGTVSPYWAQALVGIKRLRRDSDHVGVELVESIGAVAIRAELPRADRREVTWIEGQHEPASPEVREAIGAIAGPAELEVRGAVADVDPGHRPPP